MASNNQAPPIQPDHVPLFFFAILITTFCYGIACTLFVKSIGTISRKRRSTGSTNLPLVIPSIFIFIFATLHVIGLWINAYRALVINGKDPEAYFGLVDTPAKTIIQVGQVGGILLADALLVYRTFIVWNNNHNVIVIPSITFVATFMSAIFFILYQHRRMGTGASFFSTGLTHWTVAFLLTSFVTTVYSTGLIAYKLISTRMRLRRHGVLSSGSDFVRVLRIVVESAALYSLNHLLYAILYEVKSNVEAIPSFLEATVASITCSLIIVRSEKVTKIRSQSDSLPMYNGNGVVTVHANPLTYPEKKEGLEFALRTMNSEANVELEDDSKSDRISRGK